MSVRYPEPNDNNAFRHLTFCRLETDDGAVGWGEAIAMWPEACRATEVVIRGLAELVIGRDPRNASAISREIAKRAWWYGPEGIASFARSAVDVALWDLKGQVTGQSLVEMLGGAAQQQLPVIASTHAFLPSLEDEAQRHGDYIRQGFRGVKIGMGKAGDARLGYEIERDVSFARLLREAMGPDAWMMFDRGQHLRWSSADAITRAHAFADYGLTWLEEPLEPDDEVGFRHYRQHVNSLVATGERSWTNGQYRRVIESGIVDVVGCDPARVGGITASIEVLRLVEQYHRFFNAHAWSSAITTAASLALSVSSPNVLLFELKPIANPMQDELVGQRIWHHDGFISALTGPGLGITIDEAVVAKYRLD
jgi:L-alanine-DL-glutamate epimerase-like enolase superfamily enzyme